MSIINIGSRNSDYENLSVNSSDAERLDVVFGILQKSSGPIWLDYQKLFVDNSNKKVFDAKLQKTGLVWADVSKTNPTYKINEEGILVLDKYGSYSKFVIDLSNQQSIQKTKVEEKENLEMQKLRGEVDDLTNRLLDYDGVKSRSIRSDRLAIAAIILTLMGILLQWLIFRNV